MWIKDNTWIFRSSRPEVFLGKGVLKICSKFTGEHPCRSAISIKLQSNFVEITLWHECSPVNLLHIFRTRLEHLWMAASEPATSPTQKEGFFCKSITAQKMKFSIKDFPIKYDQIRRKLRLLEKPLMENFILCAVNSWKNNRKCLKIIRSQL